MCINNTRWKLHVPSFNQYCMETYELYISEYGWYPLPATSHKVLFHAGEIQQRLDLPMGAYNEGAQETTHRMRKEIRRGPTRKNCPENTMTDTFNRCLDLSDPVIATEVVRRASIYRMTDAQALAELPEEAQDLLEIPGRTRRRRVPPQTQARNLRAGRPRRDGRSARAGLQPEVQPAIENVVEGQLNQIEPDRESSNGNNDVEEMPIEDDDPYNFTDENDDHEYDYEYVSDHEVMDEN